ncbi:hypothetical protein MXB_4189 [Myxobolus squamalis]|nr:hypothetical protein MXB_4189 [Myxobolus squamalis]
MCIWCIFNLHLKRFGRALQFYFAHFFIFLFSSIYIFVILLFIG